MAKPLKSLKMWLLRQNCEKFRADGEKRAFIWAYVTKNLPESVEISHTPWKKYYFVPQWPFRCYTYDQKACIYFRGVFLKPLKIGLSGIFTEFPILRKFCLEIKKFRHSPDKHKYTPRNLKYTPEKSTHSPGN